MTPKEIEGLWDNFVPRITGKPVREIVGPSVAFPNADYVFPKDNVIAELKVLSADLERTTAGRDAIREMMEKWRAKGLIQFQFWGTRKINSADLPEECRQEIADYFGKRLMRDIRDANKQIKMTKAKLEMGNAHGLLILVNAGSYHLHADAIRYGLHRALRPRQSASGGANAVPNKSIDNVVALTIGMPAKTPELPMPTEMWLSAFRDKRQIDEEFLTRLREGWFNFMADAFGTPVPVFDSKGSDALFQMKFTGEGRKPAPWLKTK